MLKYLLFGMVEDILLVFNGGKTEGIPRIRRLLEEANARARPVWKDEAVPFATRREGCRKILRPVLKLNGKEAGTFREVPAIVVEELGNIFRRHYGHAKPGALLLIGGTDDRAYQVQDEYADAIAELLGLVDERYESRAITQLKKAYGRGSLPLLCIPSAAGLWELCKSSLYKKQISLVRLPRLL